MGGADACREPFKPSEIAAYSKRLRAIKEPEAAARKGSRTDLEPEGKFPAGESGRVSDAVAKPFKISGKTLEKIEKPRAAERAWHSCRVVAVTNDARRTW